MFIQNSNRLFKSCLFILLSTVFAEGLYPKQAWSQQNTLPPSRRVFSADLDQDGSDELLVAHNTTLTAFRYLGGDSGWSKLWSHDGPGVVQSVLRDKRVSSLIVAWGMGKGKMVAPSTVSALEPLSGQRRDLWTFQGGRSQIVNLQLVQVDNDPELELLIAHFVSKYHTRRVILDQLSSPQPQTVESSQIRMATSWLIADLDGEAGLEEVIGRVYGDEKGEYGDLSVQAFSLKGSQVKVGQIIPSERGLKTMKVLSSSQGRYLYFSDGWVAAYGKKAKATLKRLYWSKGRINVERLADSSDEFTFFDLWYRIDPDSKRELWFAHGNKGINLIIPKAHGPWKVKRLLKTAPIVNAAIAYAGNQWWAFLPSEKGTQVKALTLPGSEQIPTKQ